MAGNRGAAKNQIGSGTIAGGGSVWALEGSCISFPHFPQSPPPPKKHCHTPTATISKPPLRSPKELHLRSMLHQLRLNWHWKPPLQLFLKLRRWPSLPTWHPFTCSWVASRVFTNAGLRGAARGHQPHGLPSVHM